MWIARPLLPIRPDQSLFVETPERAKVRQLVRKGRNVLISGDRGTGRTTLLNMLLGDLQQRRRPAVDLRLTAIDDPASALWVLAQGFGDTGDAPVARPDLDNPLTAVQVVRDLAGPPRVVLVDDVSPAVGQLLFGRLRDEIWQLPHQWVATCALADGAALLQPPADAFFDAVVVLEDLSPDERLELLARRNDREDVLSASQMEQLAADGPGNPRALVRFASDVAEGQSPSITRKRLRGVDVRRERAAAAAGRPGALVVAELENLGAVSAGDQELLRRMGWTRARASQVLRKLADGGVVETTTLKRAANEPGRPKVLYSLRDAETFVP